MSPISDSLFAFLSELESNNHRDWFNENKDRYHLEVRDPALALIEQLEKPLRKSAPMLRVIAKGRGSSLMRIYRDTRFSKDKTPYKTNVGISLRHDAQGCIHAPGVYIHLANDECFVGAGCWRPERQTLAAIRAAIDADPKTWKRVVKAKAFRDCYSLAGESLKTSPRDYAKDHPMIEDLKRIDFIGISPLSRQEVLSKDCVGVLLTKIRAARPLMRFLCDAVDIPY
ncbi:MAG: DUF2461 domain-containing protein [Planctomycetota bacterium]